MAHWLHRGQTQLSEMIAYDERLKGKASNVYTQFGEDGLIETVFSEIGCRSKWCFEVGAADGIYFSNTLRLREEDWSAVLIESGAEQYEKLKSFQAESCFCIHETATDLDRILTDCGAPLDIDFGVIDIDGQDYWLWHDMEKYQPRVMLVEFHWKDGDDYIPPRDVENRNQAGPDAIIDLGRSKGYVAVARTHVNLLFVKEDLWKLS